MLAALPRCTAMLIFCAKNDVDLGSPVAASIRFPESFRRASADPPKDEDLASLKSFKKINILTSPPTTPMPPPRFARNLDARQQYEDGNLPAQNEISEKTEETANAIGTPGLNSVHQITDADTLNDPLIDHAEPEKTNATELQRVSTLVCSVCDKSFKLTNLGVLFANGPRDLRCSGSGSLPQSTDLFMPGASQILISHLKICFSP
ncbi:hypothetical protein ACOME3_005183 [Neoechinorhynchus agilis]